MLFSIFRNNRLIVSVKPEDTSELSQKKQSEDIVRLNFTLTEYVDILVGDYISLPKTGQLYVLNKKPAVIETPKNYEYECIFEGGLHQLYKTKIFLLTEKEDGSFYKDYKFPLTGTAETFLQFIVENLNRNTNAGYIVGGFEQTNTITLDFNNWNAFEAITSITEGLSLDWYPENKTLHFRNKTKEIVIPLQPGRGLGLTQLTRLRVENEDIQTVIYGYGSTKNLPNRDIYDSTLLTENRLCFSGVDGESKLEKNVNSFGRIEAVMEFDNIKPEFTGQITQIDNVATNVFFDTSVDFDVNEYLLPGMSAKVVFLSGLLIGRTFTVASYSHSTKQFVINTITEEGGIFPNQLIKPKIGDQYTFIDIYLPQTYIDDAESRLQNATQEYLDGKAKNLELYGAELDDYFVQRHSLVLELGDLVRIISAAFGIDNLYEIKELTQNINNPNKYIIKFGDVIPKNLFTVLKNINFTNQQSIYNVSNSQITNNQVTNIIGDEVVWEEI